MAYSDRLKHAVMIGLEGALCRKESPQMYRSSLCGGYVPSCLHICECVYSEGWQEEEWMEQHLRMWAIAPARPHISLNNHEQQQVLSERPKNRRLITCMAAFQLLRKECLQQPTVPPALEEKWAHRVLDTRKTVVHLPLQRLNLCSTSLTLEGGFHRKGKTGLV